MTYVDSDRTRTILYFVPNIQSFHASKAVQAIIAKVRPPPPPTGGSLTDLVLLKTKGMFEQSGKGAMSTITSQRCNLTPPSQLVEQVPQAVQSLGLQEVWNPLESIDPFCFSLGQKQTIRNHGCKLVSCNPSMRGSWCRTLV